MTDAACLNCGARIAGPFCAQCGQKVRAPDPTLREVWHEASEELVHWDGKIPATLKALFLQPGLLTLDFINGRRARWLPPLRLYLICSVLYFVSVPLLESITHRQAKQAIRMGFTATRDVELTPKDRADLDSSAVVRWIGRERLERMLANGPEFNRRLATEFPKAMFVLLPLFALLTRVAFRKTVPNYPAHLYFAMHEHAAGFGALTVSKMATLVGYTAVDVVAAFAALAYIGWHAFRAARLVFGGSTGRTIVRGTAVAVVYWAFVIVATLVLIAYTFATL